MDIETQMAFIISQKKQHQDALDALTSIEDTLTDKVAPIISSIAPLVEENTTLKTMVSDKDEQIASLTEDLQTALAPDPVIEPPVETPITE